MMSSPIFLLLTIIPLGLTLAEPFDLTIVEYLNSITSFDKYSQMIGKEVKCAKDNSDSEDGAKIQLLDILQKHLPWVKDDRVKTFEGDFKRSQLCGPYSVQYGNYFVHATLRDHRVSGGPLVYYHNASITVKNVEEEKEEYWMVRVRTAMFVNATGRFLASFWKGEKECPCLQLDDDGGTQLILVENLETTKNSFLRPTFSSTGEMVQLDTPPHLMSEQEKELLTFALHSFLCQNINLRSKPHLPSADVQLFYHKSSTRKSRHHFWDRAMLGDDKCYRFSELSWPEVGTIHKTTLACYPGSGSKWAMELIEFASGIGTMSAKHNSQLLHKTHHDDAGLLVDIMMGKRDSYSRKPDLMERLQQILAADGRGILLLRNPYEAIVSWWNHIQTGSAINGGLSARELSESVRTDRFCRYAQSEIRMWRVLTLDWISLIEDLVVVHYENLKADYEKDLKKLLQFLRVPVDGERFKCLAKYPSLGYKRKMADLGDGAFCSEAAVMIAEAVEEVNGALESHSFEPLPVHLYKYYKRNGTNREEL